jgi:hypothetical protein
LTFQQQFIILKNEILNTIFPEVVSGNYIKAIKYFEKTYLGYMKIGMEKSPIFPVKCRIIMIMMMKLIKRSYLGSFDEFLKLMI